MLGGHLRDMHQALDAVHQLYKTSKADQLGDLALDNRADWEALDLLAPGVLGGLLQAQGDALPVQLDFQNLYFNLVADLDHLRWVADMAPAKLADMHQAVDAAKVDKGAEVHD